MVTMDRTCERVGDTVVSKTLDDRLSVFVMIEALRLLKNTPIQAEILAVATDAGRGRAARRDHVRICASARHRDCAGRDACRRFRGYAGKRARTSLGNGAAIKIVDSSLLCHPKLVRISGTWRRRRASNTNWNYCHAAVRTRAHTAQPGRRPQFHAVYSHTLYPHGQRNGACGRHSSRHRTARRLPGRSAYPATRLCGRNLTYTGDHFNESILSAGQLAEGLINRLL